MTKEDLKYGNIIEMRNGDLYFLCNNSRLGRMFISLTDYHKYAPINEYNDDLTYKDDLTLIEHPENPSASQLDIIKVYKDYTFREMLWERKELIKLSDDEKVILQNLNKDYKYIARDKDGILRICVGGRLVKGENHWFSKYYYSSSFPYTNLFQFIK